ncbi:histone-lysine N-methyltransferase [Pseudozyma hubeiensis SY62]|uniref:Histone-lysine N-methyltransferase n=1 Tax=Pseudozyma hubeiensis (strain SY62) TaxID=1305764 RepID=R9P2E0_PSEHS|nr:histone-lysine N-methyltransferase [Pseudozyma hubeiensis SY62]GAC95486.1 histone-lysine N-methyltransferase [Pseudozyma hubeiensis SY62]
MTTERRQARTSTPASGSSSPVIITRFTQSAPSLQSKKNVAPRVSRRSALAAAPRILQGASTSSADLHADNSLDDPIIVSDTDSDVADSLEAADILREHMSSSQGPNAAVNGASQHLSRTSAHREDESRSSTTLDRSYATSLSSDLNALSDGSLSSLSSVESDSDAAETPDDDRNMAFGSPKSTPRPTRKRNPAYTPLRGSQVTPEATAESSSSTPTPSRRSARIVSSGSSVQKALQRRDELDAKMLAVPVRRKPETPEAPPIKRPVGRPRKVVATADTATTGIFRPASLQADATAPAQSPPSASPTRRSARLSLPFTSAATGTYSLPPKPEADENVSHELRRGTRPRASAPQSGAFERLLVPNSPHAVQSSSGSPSSAVPKASVAPSGVVGGLAESVPVPPVKRGRGRPRKSLPIVPAPSPILATLTVDRKESGLVSRLRKRSLSTAGLDAASESPIVVAQEQVQQGTPRRKRGRPARKDVTGTKEETPRVSPSPLPERVLHSRADARNFDIDLLDDDLSELSDVSDMSVDSSQPSRSTSQSAQPGERRRGRPPSASTLLAKKLKRASKLDKDGKVYHCTGLYAGEADAVPSTSSVRPTSTHNMLLPEPVHFGAKLLSEERDFCLPYPIHQSMDTLRDRVNAKRKPPRYQQISKNKYYSRAKLQGEVPLCNCEPGSGCGNDCINRMLQFICDPRTCPSGANCTNISLGRRPNVKTTVAYYGRRGFGLKTLEAINRDDFIDEYRGEVINLGEAAKRVTEEYKATGNFYLLDYDSAAGELLDGGRKGNITRFANHSCDPNCRIEKFIICGTDEALSAEFQIGLFANRDVAEGEELTYNYGWAAFQPRDITGAPTAQVPTEQCLCGAANCSGILGGKKAPVSKAVADVVTANSRKKTAKGQGKGKGKMRKSSQSSSIRMRAMTPMLNVSRLSAAAMPSSALLTSKAKRAARQREEAQTSLNLLNKIVIKRRERSARGARTTSLPASALITNRPAAPVSPTNTEPGSLTGSQIGKQASRSKVGGAGGGKKSASKHQESASSSAPTTYPATDKAGTASIQGVSLEGGSGTAGVDRTVPDDARPSATSMVFSRLPLLKRVTKKRLGAGFGLGATGARGTKDRRWSAAEARTSDNDDSSSSRSDSESRTPEFQEESGETKQPAKPKKAGRRGRHKLQLSDDEAARRATERRARNAFLARVRRASKRGILIDDPTQHPLKKISIQCTAAPENTYIPDLPSSLVTLGMTTADARRARNAFLARVRRAMKRGYAKEVAIKMAAKPLPGDPDRDTPVMKAQRAYMEQLERDAADELTGSVYDTVGTSQAATGSNASSVAGDDGWRDESSWAVAQ